MDKLNEMLRKVDDIERSLSELKKIVHIKIVKSNFDSNDIIRILKNIEVNTRGEEKSLKNLLKDILRTILRLKK